MRLSSVRRQPAQVYRYDQLNRLKQAQGVQVLTGANTWDGVTDATADRYKSQYTYDANGNIQSTKRWDDAGTQYDDLAYHYEQVNNKLLRNRLYHLNESINGGYGDIGVDASTFHGTHADVNALNNYKYDELGNLIADKREEIANIEWTVSGKVKHITRTVGSTKPELWFTYGADGQRISKTVGDPLSGGYREWYLRDAQGNIMAMYKYADNGASLKVTERPVYGSSRLGSYTRQIELVGEQTITNYPYTQPMQAPLKRYELTDHLGNVNTVVTGRLLPLLGPGVQYQAEVVSATGYEAFGSLLPGRNYSSDSYRFGFNGKENDNEWHGAVGTMQDYGLRAYDTRVARFFAVDPLAPQYPMLTPYQFASNMPIWAVDLDGAEAWVYTETDGVGHAFIVVPSSDDVKELVVYSYGRYNGSSTPSLGGFGPVGDGVLIKKEGQSAKEYIRERLSLDNGKSTFVFEFPKADAEKIRNYFDAQFNNGTPLPTGSKAEQKYGDEAKVVDQYIIAPMFGQKASNCVTKTCAGIERGGSLDEFTPVGDGGAYIDLRNQIDPKVMGGLLWMMGRQDAADNPNNRNVIDVTDQQKNDYGIAPK